MEHTSYIMDIAYDIENWLAQGLTFKQIEKKIVELQNEDPSRFPKDLTLVDCFYDTKTTLSGCAFKNSDGDIIIGFAGTNFDHGTLDGFEDIEADIAIGDRIHPMSNGYTSIPTSRNRKYTYHTFVVDNGEVLRV